MQTFKEHYLAEARDTTKGKGVDKDTAKKLYKEIDRFLRADMSREGMNRYDRSDGSWWNKDYRVYDLFTDRPGEEDDDWPEFTGGKQLEKGLNKILKGIGWSASPSEKSWIDIEIKAKKLSKKQIKSNAKKKIEDAIRLTRNALYDTNDRYWREFYKDMESQLEKWKKKFITRDQYMELAKNAKWRETEAAEYAWDE